MDRPCCDSLPAPRDYSLLQVFRAQGGILARTLWWDDSENFDSISLGGPAFQDSSHGGSGGSESGDGYDDWEVARDRSDARHCLRQLVREAMALADFSAKDNPRGKVGRGGAVKAVKTRRCRVSGRCVLRYDVIST